jgi:predicted phosphodiesterase
MRYGVLSDIHGNLHALLAVLELLRREQVDAFLCAGDLVGYGPLPNECVEAIAQLRGVCVAGNHELLALGRLSEERSGALCRQTLGWTRTALREDVRRYLSRLPLRAEAPGGVLVTHGSLSDPQTYIRDSAEARSELDHLVAEHPGARTLILGHTHRSWAFGRHTGSLRIGGDGRVRLAQREPHLLNPGSVGQSRERERVPRARCMVLDLEHGWATFYAIPYDVESCRRELLRQEGLPEHAYHVRGSRLFALVGQMRRRLRQRVRTLTRAARGLSQRELLLS